MSDVDPRLVAEITAQVLERLGPQRAPAPPPAERTFGELWLEYLETLRGERAKKSRSRSRHFFRPFRFQGHELKLADLVPSQMVPALLQAWISLLEGTKSQQGPGNLSAGFVDQIRMDAQACFKLHVRRGELEVNPFHKVGRDKNRRRHRQGYYTPDEVEREAAAMPQIGGVFLRHLFRTCQRFTSLRLLEKTQIDWAGKELVLVVKGGRQERVAVPDDILEEMRHLCAMSPGKYVYPNPLEPLEPIPESTLRKWKTRARKKTGLVLPGGEAPNFHHGRHGGALALLDAGADLTEVQAQLCHSSIQQTAIYLKMRDRRRERLRDKLNAVGKLR